MPEVREDIVGGANYGEFRTFHGRSSADPFKVVRDISEGDFIALNMPTHPFRRTYEVTHVFSRGDTYYPAVELLDLHSGRRGIMTQTALNRLRPLKIYRPRRGFAPERLTRWAIYQDIQTGVVVRAVPEGDAGEMTLVLKIMKGMSQPMDGWPYGAFDAESGMPKLVLRWKPREEHVVDVHPAAHMAAFFTGHVPGR